MLGTAQTTRFDVVSCMWMDHEPWRSIPRGYRRYEGTLDVEDGTLVHRIGATRGTVDGLPVFDNVHQFFVAPTELLRRQSVPRLQELAEIVDALGRPWR